ncbi:hypothetical protein GGR55DRAFT_628725 [Xylaria sp. FL0064]|nr:hypothetical protein GGR55DRAFT_628725 [Xylaria sp. FL0064]
MEQPCRLPWTDKLLFIYEEGHTKIETEAEPTGKLSHLKEAIANITETRIAIIAQARSICDALERVKSATSDQAERLKIQKKRYQNIIESTESLEKSLESDLAKPGLFAQPKCTLQQALHRINVYLERGQNIDVTLRKCIEAVREQVGVLESLQI